MKNYYLKALTLLSCLLIGITAHAHDFEAQNSDGAKIYYDITSSTDKTVSVTYQGSSSTENVEYSGEITIPETVTYNGTIYSVTSIDSYAFSTCSGLTSVEIPNSIIHIGEEAFINCVGLSSITIPNSITSIGNYAFYNCIALRELQIEKGESTLSLGYNRYNSSGTGKGLFYDCPLETLYIGRNISYSSEKSYGYSPFYNKTTLKSITISNSVTSIGDYAFNGCNSFTSITIPNSITIIGDWTFANCGALVSVEISNSVTNIGEDAFLRCTSLTEITCESVMPPTAYSNTFQNVPTTATLYVPAGSKEAYASAEGWSHFTNIVEYDTITGVESSFADDSVAISVENGNIVVNGVADNVNVEVYDVNGQSIYCGTATTIPVAVKGLYIVKVNGKSFKVLL